MSWADYVKRTAGDDLNRVIAQRAGVTEPNVSRWKAGGMNPAPAAAAAFARAYNRPVLEAFIAAGYITEAEAKVRPVAAPSLNSLSDEELVGEILHRMTRGGGGDAGSAAPMKHDQAGARQSHLRAARTGESRGKLLRDELDAAGEESQGEAPDGGA